ncbi:CheR family methyltransferase [Neptunomonas marina]|uniref:Chemotaxis protein methyltransferase n=1 Tax=Neptunomonas marina TaxID=1815562 RepID=A0A437Q6D0_9GAMM|nr:protein-glutamate O-methyltransferase CheR [Neptunomonas marina]RVU30072.1 protein-glutamate O-methyltransferase CheR [Neptunomonas marina]
MAVTSPQATEREFIFTQKDFERVRKELYAHAGITLSDHKKDMTYNRLVRRLRELGLNSFDEYFAYLTQHDDEFGMFINALTTNLTSFFRENHHFEYLQREIIASAEVAASRRLRIWSAGCSMGEEPYSIAISCMSAPVETQHWDIQILATDIDTKVLQTGANGIYGIERIESIPAQLKRRFFRRGKGAQEGNVKVAPELQQLITFKQLNLMEALPFKGPLDVIFCRNVMIYFDKETQQMLLDKFAEVLKPGGILFVGHSESPFRLTDRFKLIGQTVYRKVY